MSDVCRVVCLGGGYSTMHVVKALRGAVSEGAVHVTVIDKNNYHVFHGLVAEMLVGKILPGNIVSPARKLFKGADFHNGEVESVDFVKQEVVTSRALDGKKYKVPYDHLVISLGSNDNLSRYAGVAENAFRLKSYWDVFELRNHITASFEMAEIESEREERQRLLTFVIAGGNYAGIEVATELSEYVEELTSKYYPRVDISEVRVVVLHSGETILPELGKRFPGLVRYAEKRLEKTNVEVQYGQRIKSATPVSAVTESGMEIKTRTIISCTGNAQSPLFDDWNFERDELGRLKTNEYLNILTYDNVWSGGDCAAVPHPKGGTCPPLAIFAMTAGKVIGKNILRSIQNKTLKRYSFTGLGDACSLARRRAVGHLYGVPVTGLLAWLTWRLFMLIYLPIWDRRVRTFFDWMVWPFVGRDVASIRSNHQLNIQELYFDSGQEVVKEGDDGNGMFIIYEGEVEIIKKGKKQAKLGPGEFFGEVAVLEECKRTATVKACTALKLIEIKKHVAGKLRATLRR